MDSKKIIDANCSWSEEAIKIALEILCLGRTVKITLGRSELFSKVRIE